MPADTSVVNRGARPPDSGTDIHLSILDRVRIASPCSMKWEDMEGDDRTRFCRECSLHVHNISAMSRAEAERFLHERLAAESAIDAARDALEGRPPRARVCGLIFRRADGTIVTRDCPVGIAALREKARRAVSRVLAVAVFVLTSGIAWASRSSGSEVRRMQPFAGVLEWLSPAPVPVPGKMVMGDVCAPPSRGAGSGPSSNPGAGQNGEAR